MNRKTFLLALLTAVSIVTSTKAGTIAAASGAIAAGTAAVLVKGNPATKALAVGGSAIVGGLVGEFIEDRSKQKQLETYMLGRYHEAYIRAYSPWYRGTLDPTTGRPPAFDGYWAMDVGMPDQTGIQPMPTTRVVPKDRGTYEETLPQVIEKREEDIARAAATSEIISRKKVVNGVEYAAQKVIYPRLPARRQ